METQEIIIYLDEGVDPHACRRVASSLRKSKAGHRLKTVNRHYFLTPDWEKKTTLVIFPGGQDIPYDRALRGAANKRIKAYVEGGGRYFGICAGAYYGAAEIEFELGYPHEVCESRELAFFPKKAIGPAYEKNVFRYDSKQGARIAQIAFEGKVAPVYFNGGCYFEPSLESEVLGSYHDHPGRPSAIVSCRVGLGKAILCGVHPEYVQPEPENEQLWNFLLDRLLN